MCSGSTKPGKEHRCEREHRQPCGHASSLAGSAGAGVARLTVPSCGRRGWTPDRPPRLARVLNRIDLRGGRRVTRAACCPVPSSTSRWPSSGSARSWRRSGSMATRRSGRPASGSTGSRPEVLRVPAEAIAEAEGTLDPTCAPRCWSRSPGPAGCTPTSGAPTTPPRWCPAARSPSAGCRSTGSASTSPAAWRMYPSTVVMNVVPAQAAGVALAGRGQPAAEGQRRPARRAGARRLRAARRRRGVRRRRRPGGGDARRTARRSTPTAVRTATRST